DTFDDVLATFDGGTRTETTRFFETGPGGNYLSQVLIDGDTAWIAIPDAGILVKWSISGDAELQRTSALGTPYTLAQDATNLYIGRTGEVISVAKSDMTTITATSGAYPDGASHSGLNEIRLINGFLYVTYGPDGGGGFARITT